MNGELLIKENFTEIQKQRMIKKEILRLSKIFKEMESDKFDTASSLIEEAAFMTVTLKDLRKTINRDGSTTVYQNGENQWGTKKSPEVDIYNTMIKNHMSIVKQMTDLLPKAPASPGGDDFDSF